MTRDECEKSDKTWQTMKKSYQNRTWKPCQSFIHSSLVYTALIIESKLILFLFKGSKKNQEMLMFSSDKSASKYWPRVIYSIALIRLSAWIILITFCLVCFESSAVELNKLIRESRPHFSGLTVEQTRDFLIIYLIFGVLYVLIDRKYPFFITLKLWYNEQVRQTLFVHYIR